MLHLLALAYVVGRLGLRVGQLGLGGQQVALGRDAGVVLVGGDLQRAAVALDGEVGQPLQLVVGPQLHIVDGQFGLGREAGVGQIGGAGLGAGPGAFHGAADLAPQVRGPAGAEAHLIRGAGVGDHRRAGIAGGPRGPRDPGGRPAGGDHGGSAAAAGMGDRAVGGDGGEQLGAVLGDDGVGLAVGGLGGGDVLVGDHHLLLEVAQHRVVEHGPPVAARGGVIRLGADPALGLLELGRGSRGWAHIVGADHAGGQHGGGDEGEGANGGAGHGRSQAGSGGAMGPSAGSPRLIWRSWGERLRKRSR